MQKFQQDQRKADWFMLCEDLKYRMIVGDSYQDQKPFSPNRFKRFINHKFQFSRIS